MHLILMCREPSFIYKIKGVFILHTLLRKYCLISEYKSYLLTFILLKTNMSDSNLIIEYLS